MARKIEISVIVSTYNEAENLPPLLASLKKQSLNKLEIIVVDNYSTDQTVTIAKGFTASVFTVGGERSNQRNFGAKKAHGRVLMFLDADMELPPAVSADCVSAFNNSQISALVIPETVPRSGLFARVKRLEKQLYLNEPLIEAPRVFRKSSFLKIGGYDEKLIAGEDWDLGQRVKQVGKIGRISTSLYHHETSLWRELKHKWYYAKKIGEYSRLHPQIFGRQRGSNRVWLFWKKRHFLLTKPFTASGLVILKSVELLLYCLVKMIYS